MNSDIRPLVEDLDTNIDALAGALAPILTTALSSTASKLPLLDKAKLYVLATYALESILFSYLRLHGQDAKSHPVFAELSRVKAYFAKISAAETAGAGTGAPRQLLDKDAAGRFVKHGLAGNERYDRARAERQQSERAAAKRKLDALGVGTHTRFDGVSKRARENEVVSVVSAASLGEGVEDDGGEGVNETGMTKAEARPRLRGTDSGDDRQGTSSEPGTRVKAGEEGSRLSNEENKRLRREAKKERRRIKKGEEARANEMK